MDSLLLRAISIILIPGLLTTSSAGQIPADVLQMNQTLSQTPIKTIFISNGFEVEALASRALLFSGDLRPKGPLEVVDQEARGLESSEVLQPSRFYNSTGIAFAIGLMIVGIAVVGMIEVLGAILTNARRALGYIPLKIAA